MHLAIATQTLHALFTLKTLIYSNPLSTCAICQVGYVMAQLQTNVLTISKVQAITSAKTLRLPANQRWLAYCYLRATNISEQLLHKTYNPLDSAFVFFQIVCVVNVKPVKQPGYELFSTQNAKFSIKLCLISPFTRRSGSETRNRKRTSLLPLRGGLSRVGFRLTFAAAS